LKGVNGEKVAKELKGLTVVMVLKGLIEGKVINGVKPGFPTAGVPSRSKMYRTSATSDLHSVLHFAQKNKLYCIHFAEKIYTLILRP